MIHTSTGDEPLDVAAFRYQGKRSEKKHFSRVAMGCHSEYSQTREQTMMKSGFPLRKWLARELLVKTLRKPPVKERRGPVRDAAYLRWIRTLPCTACGIEGRSRRPATCRACRSARTATRCGPTPTTGWTAGGVHSSDAIA